MSNVLGNAGLHVVDNGGETPLFWQMKTVIGSGIFDIQYYNSITSKNFFSIESAVSHFFAEGLARGFNPNPLFDAKFYEGQVSFGDNLGINPLVHYIVVGAKLGYNPSPLFSSKHYLETNTDVADARLNPLSHFLNFGAAERRNPHPLFDVDYYLRRHPDVEQSGVNPLAHYLTVGAAMRYDPHPLFSSTYYMRCNEDVANLGLNPLAHYANYGCHEGRDPHPLFSTHYFWERHPEARAQKKSALEYYLSLGPNSDHSPNPLFNARYYFETYPDALAAGMAGLLHFLLIGSDKGYKPNPMFDPAFYNTAYPDVAASGANPLLHYAWFGHAEGRDPSASFCTSFYKSTYPDVAASGVNPLNHFLLQGFKEGRYPRVPNYTDWWQKHQPLDDEHLRRCRREIATFRYLPIFSIVVPTYNTAPDILRAALDSVCRQVYPYWELCLADDASTKPHVRDILEEYANADARIKVLYRETNGHISVATNSALTLANGDYISLMDHDDEITPDALYWLARKLNEDPRLDMVYSDEDKMRMDGERYEPFIKPDWSPDYLESCMYTAHFACYRTNIVQEIGGFREGYHGAQDYDFVLRFTEKTTRIAHVPRILYHWRAIPGSTATSMDEKDYVIDAAIRALEDRLKRTGGLEFVRSNMYKGCFDVRRPIVGEPLVSIVIPSAGRSYPIRGVSTDILVNCIDLIYEKSTYRNFEIIVVDNNDLRPSTLDALKKYPIKYVHFYEEFNIAKKINLGVAEASGEYLLLLNDDIEVISPDWLEAMISVLQKPGVGAVGAKLYFDDGTLQHVGVAFNNGLPDHIYRQYPGQHPGHFFSTVAMHNYLAVTGACVLTKRDLYLEVGGFDERLGINYNDVDFCLKVHKEGQRIVYCPQAELYHFESINRVRSVDDGEIDYFLEKWKSYVAHDPYYSAYFSAKPPNFQLIDGGSAIEELRQYM